MQRPAMGFENLGNGSVFGALIAGQVHDLGFSAAVRGSFIPGDNTGYSFSQYGTRFGVKKSNWMFSPVADLGFDYCLRKLGQTAERGLSLSYGLGMELTFRYESLLVYPKLAYEGLTDLTAHGGFISLGLGISYEL